MFPRSNILQSPSSPQPVPHDVFHCRPVYPQDDPLGLVESLAVGGRSEDPGRVSDGGRGPEGATRGCLPSERTFLARISRTR